MFWSRALGASALILVAGNVVAAPPSSCANKFVGVWQHGTSNVAKLTPNGQPWQTIADNPEVGPAWLTIVNRPDFRAFVGDNPLGLVQFAIV